MAATKVVIVTGGLGGIGSVSARLLAESGWHVVVSDVTERGGHEFAETLSACGTNASFFPADLVEEAQVQALVAHAVGRFGRLDGAINAAAIPQHEKPLVDLTVDEFEKVMRTNVLTTFLCLKHQMLAMSDGGAIVNLSSGLGVMALPNRTEYIASKHAICGLTRAAAVEGASRNIRVNAVLPGSIDTATAQAQLGPGALERARRLHLIQRMGRAEEVGQAARWLLSNEASFVTGAMVPVDGGLTAGRQA